MAKLNKATAKKVDESNTGFEPIPDGVYHLMLEEVDPDKTGKTSGEPYWLWQYKVVEPGDAEGRKLFNNTSLQESAFFAFKQTFDAFGVPTDTDTDELIGKVVRGVVSTTTIQSGPREGEPSNQIDRLMPPADDFEVPAGAAASSGGGEDIF